MRIVTILFLFCSFSLSSVAQKSMDYLLKRPHPNGMLYHVKSMELESCGKKESEIDYTIVASSTNDTGSVLFTFNHRSFKGIPDSLEISQETFSLKLNKSDIKALYIDKEKKYWSTRLELELSEDDFFKVIKGGWIMTYFSNGESCEISIPKKTQTIMSETSEMIEVEQMNIH